MKVQKSSAYSHPEGWSLFKVISEEAVDGKFGTQIKFNLQSSQKNEDGEPLLMTYFTGTKLSQHEKCKLTQLFIACGIVDSYDEIDDNEDEWDTAVLIGKVFEGRVDEPTKEGGFSNIGAVRPRKARTVKAAKAQPKEETDFEDPFADE